MKEANKEVRKKELMDQQLKNNKKSKKVAYFSAAIFSIFQTFIFMLVFNIFFSEDIKFSGLTFFSLFIIILIGDVLAAPINIFLFDKYSNKEKNRLKFNEEVIDLITDDLIDEHLKAGISHIYSAIEYNKKSILKKVLMCLIDITVLTLFISVATQFNWSFALFTATSAELVFYLVFGTLINKIMSLLFTQKSQLNIIKLLSMSYSKETDQNISTAEYISLLKNTFDTYLKDFIDMNKKSEYFNNIIDSYKSELKDKIDKRKNN